MGEPVEYCRRQSPLRAVPSPRFTNHANSLLRRAAAYLSIALFCLALTGLARAKDKHAAIVAFVDPTAGSTYVGADTCKTCHADVYDKTFVNTPHGALLKEGKHGCEDCHGAGSAHVEGGGDKTKIFSFKGVRPETISRRCMTCHEANPEQREFMRSTHNENGVNCLSCHSVHNSKLEYLLVQKQTPLCFSCHAEQRADFQKPFHHRVEEGLIQCNDCHNPHGALRDRQLRSTPDQDIICFKCHSDKRGPFVFEHEPVKGEGCQTCHTAHGSPYPRMLLTARINSLCLQCHVTIPSGPHPQNAIRQDCILCHMSIHGSNIDPRFFR
jgi:DmsE family decaheme c-type cytochrome